MQRDATPLWIGLLAAASLLSTLALACATPFAALAAIAAVHMRRRAGAALLLLCWAASQAVGFLWLGYACNATTLGWGAALGLGADAAVVVAGLTDRRMRERAIVPRLAIAGLVAFGTFKLVILVAALLLGDVADLIAPALLARQIVREGAFLIGLELFHRLLAAVGLPALPARRGVMA